MAARAMMLLRRLSGVPRAALAPALVRHSAPAVPVTWSRSLSSKDDAGTGRASAVRDVDTDSASGTDSDVDKKKGQIGTTEFWRQKMRTVHAIMDVNKDGVVSFEDFKMLGDKFIELGHLSKEQQAEFRRILKNIWEEQWGPADPYNMVNAYQYLDCMFHVMNDKALKKKAYRFLPYLFKAVDKDKSGTISVEEYKLFFKCLNLKEEEAVVSFRAIDHNNDNRLSLKEFVKVGREFFSSEDVWNPSKNFWGPLVQDHCKGHHKK